MSGYRFGLSCPACGGPLKHQAGGTTNGWDTRAVALCQHCCDQIVIEVRISSAKRHGTAMKGTTT